MKNKSICIIVVTVLLTACASTEAAPELETVPDPPVQREAVPDPPVQEEVVPDPPVQEEVVEPGT